MAVGNRCADHVTPLYPQNLAITSPTGGGRSVGIFRSRTKATQFSFIGLLLKYRCLLLRNVYDLVPDSKWQLVLEDDSGCLFLLRILFCFLFINTLFLLCCLSMCLKVHNFAVLKHFNKR